jgi:hypothetical protein
VTFAAPSERVRNGETVLAEPMQSSIFSSPVVTA